MNPCHRSADCIRFVVRRSSLRRDQHCAKLPARLLPPQRRAPDGAIIRAWELTVRSPRIAHLGQAHLAYSNQIAEQRGAITGGLVCAAADSPECAASFAYTPLDHDQRNTLNAGFNAMLPLHATASTNVYYGSGFTNGAPDPNTPYPNPYLPQHTTFDLFLGKSLGEDLSVSVTASNTANRRVLLDNSLTFGGTHYNDPRQS